MYPFRILLRNPGFNYSARLFLIAPTIMKRRFVFFREQVQLVSTKGNQEPNSTLSHSQFIIVGPKFRIKGRPIHNIRAIL